MVHLLREVNVIYADKERKSAKMVINHKISKVSDQSASKHIRNIDLLKNIQTAYMCYHDDHLIQLIKSYTQEINIDTSQHTYFNTNIIIVCSKISNGK